MSRLLTSAVFYECEPLATVTATAISDPLATATATATATAITTAPGAVGAVPTYTTVYTTTMFNACPTSEWIETYTITETCVGNSADYTRPAVPTNFITTVVVCDVCEHKTQTVYCPEATEATAAPAAPAPSAGSEQPSAPAQQPPPQTPDASPAQPSPGGAAQTPGSSSPSSEANPSSGAPASPDSNSTVSATAPSIPVKAGAPSVRVGALILAGAAMVLVPFVF